MDNIKEVSQQFNINNPGKTGNTLAYILSVEDASIKAKARYLVTTKLTHANNYVEILGSELNGKLEADEIKTRVDVEKTLNATDKVNLYIPWQKVLNIRVVR